MFRNRHNRLQQTAFCGSSCSQIQLRTLCKLALRTVIDSVFDVTNWFNSCICSNITDYLHTNIEMPTHTLERCTIVRKTMFQPFPLLVNPNEEAYRTTRFITPRKCAGKQRVSRLPKCLRALRRNRHSTRAVDNGTSPFHTGFAENILGFIASLYDPPPEKPLYRHCTG